MAIEFESTYAKAKRDDEGYRKSISTIVTWGEKVKLLPCVPDLCSLYYPGSDTLVINIHGGNFVYKHPLDDDALCKYISKTYCISVLNVDFSNSIKWGYPVQLVEIDRQINNFLFDHPMKRIILMGYDSGANLAASIVERWIKNNVRKATALILNYPLLDLSTVGNDSLNELISFYMPNKINRKDPFISPLYIPKKILKEFPPTYIVSCENDEANESINEFVKLLNSERVENRNYISSKERGFIEEDMGDVYHLPNETRVRYAKSIVDQSIVFALTTK